MDRSVTKGVQAQGKSNVFVVDTAGRDSPTIICEAIQCRKCS